MGHDPFLYIASANKYLHDLSVSFRAWPGIQNYYL